MSDLVERLRDYEVVGVTALPRLCGEAADRIEALEADDKVFSDNMIALEDENTKLLARIETLEAALRDIRRQRWINYSLIDAILDAGK